jgi:hypothetical protein
MVGETVTGPISTAGLFWAALCAIAVDDSDTEESREIRKTREKPGVTPARK